MFGKKLIEARTNSGLTQEQLAEKIYVTRQAVSRWENGKTEPDIQMLARLCAVLEVSADYFIEVPKELRKFDKISKEEQFELRYEFGKQYKNLFFIIKFALIWSIVCFSIGSGALIAMILTINFRTLTSIIGMVCPYLSCISMLMLFFERSALCSKIFNRWLFERCIVRNAKLIL